MSYPAVVRMVSKQSVDPRSVFCAGCPHSEFLHSDYEARRCLYSECGCTGWRRLIEHDETTARKASEG